MCVEWVVFTRHAAPFWLVVENQLWIDLTNFKTKTCSFLLTNLAWREIETKVVNYTPNEPILMLVWSLQWWQGSTTNTALPHEELKIVGVTKINLASSILLQMIKFQKSWLRESLLSKCTLLIDVQSTGSTFIISWKFSFTEQLHSTTFAWQSTASRAPHIFLDSFLVLKIMLVYAKIFQATKMSRSLQNLDLKNFREASRHNLREICQQDRHGCWHRYFHFTQITDKNSQFSFKN